MSFIFQDHSMIMSKHNQHYQTTVVFVHLTLINQ